MATDKTGSKTSLQFSRAPAPISPIRGTGRTQISATSAPGQSADWNKWAYMLTGEVWRAVALSLNIEPEALPGLDSRPLAERPFYDCSPEFRRRLEITCNHIDNRALQCTDSVPNVPYSIVNLSDFAAWAHALGWSLPEGLRRKPLPTSGKIPHGSARSAYEARVAAIRAERGRNPPIQNMKDGLEGDREWATRNGVSRVELKKWRQELFGIQKRGRRKIRQEIRQKNNSAAELTN
jgi:hypothetical protein